MMKCPDVRQLFSAYLDNELAAELQMEVHRHITECPECAHECRSLEKSIQLIKRFKGLPLPHDYAGKLS